MDRLAMDLKRSFPDMKGFSPRNLKYMRAFAEAWTDESIVQAVLAAQITWYHNIAILEKLTTSEDRVWYARATKHHGWSRNVLAHQIEAGWMRAKGRRLRISTARFRRHNPIWHGTSQKTLTISISSRWVTTPTNGIASAACSITFGSFCSNWELASLLSEAAWI
jgi:hypothetical protein